MFVLEDRVDSALRVLARRHVRDRGHNCGDVHMWMTFLTRPA